MAGLMVRTARWFLVTPMVLMGLSLAVQARPTFEPSPLNPSETVNDPTHQVVWSLGGNYTLKSLKFMVALMPNGSNAALFCQHDGAVVPNCSYQFGYGGLSWSATSTIYTQLNMDYSGDYSLRWEALAVAATGDETTINGVYTIRYSRQSLEDLVEINLPEGVLTVRLAESSGKAYKIPMTINARTTIPVLGGRLIIDSQGIPCKVINEADGSEHECTGMVLPAITDDKPADLDILLKNIDQSAVSSNTPLAPVITAKVDTPGAKQAKARVNLYLKESLWRAILLVAAGVFVTYGLRVLVVTVKPNLVLAKMGLDAAVWLDDAVRRLTANGQLDAEQQELLNFVRSYFDALVRGRINLPKTDNQATVVTGLAENTVYWLRKYSEAGANNPSIAGFIKARDDFMNQMVDSQSVEQFKTDTTNAVTALRITSSPGRVFTPARFKTSRTRVVLGLAVISLVRYLVFFLVAGLSGYSLLWAGADTWGGTESYIVTFLWGMGISLSGTGVISFAVIEDQLRLKPI